jgi:hypothetical protein
VCVPPTGLRRIQRRIEGTHGVRWVSAVRNPISMSHSTAAVNSGFSVVRNVTSVQLRSGRNCTEPHGPHRLIYVADDVFRR